MGTIQHAHGGRVETMCWADPWEESAVKICILEANSAANQAAEPCAERMESQMGSGMLMCQTAGS